MLNTKEKINTNIFVGQGVTYSIGSDSYAMTVIKYAMEEKLKLKFVSKSGDQYIEDSRYIKAMENAGLFGKNTTSGMPVKYFGQ